MYQIREANQMVEEFMLAANISVAEKILKHFPMCSLLRYLCFVALSSYPAKSLTADKKTPCLILNLANKPFATSARYHLIKRIIEYVIYCWCNDDKQRLLISEISMRWVWTSDLGHRVCDGLRITMFHCKSTRVTACLIM